MFQAMALFGFEHTFVKKKIIDVLLGFKYHRMLTIAALHEDAKAKLCQRGLNKSRMFRFETSGPFLLHHVGSHQ